MPPQLQQLLQNRNALIGIGVGVVLLIVLIILGSVFMGGGGKQVVKGRALNANEKTLATVDNAGKAIEIQALLARENINLVREDVEGGKSNLIFENEATTEDRDRALVTLVQSGLVDKNVGLEIFDKGDLTASREEKRIKLARARNGELSRLIRKIDPVVDSTVFISIPEPTLFEKDKKDPMATVQVTIPNGEKLSSDKVRAIVNLLVGSVEGLKSENVSLTDTNGNVYSSVLNSSFEMMSKLEERDQYMEQKVRAQLDKLIGAGKYVATVSTYLREASREEMILDYPVEQSAVSHSSSFSEGMDANQANNYESNGVTLDLPDELALRGDLGNRDNSSSEGYKRSGKETSFSNGKRQINQGYGPGMLEEITVAVTIDENAYPNYIAQDELKRLIARAASPKVRPTNVSVLVDGKEGQFTPESSAKFKQPAEAQPLTLPDWILWAALGVGGLLFLIFIALLLKPAGGANKKEMQKQNELIRQLQEMTENQAEQIQLQQEQAKQMMALQQQQMAQLQAAPQQQLVGVAPAQAAVQKDQVDDIRAALANVDDLFADEDSQETMDMLSKPASGVKTWIESSS